MINPTESTAPTGPPRISIALLDQGYVIDIGGQRFACESGQSLLETLARTLGVAMPVRVEYRAVAPAPAYQPPAPPPVAPRPVAPRPTYTPPPAPVAPVEPVPQASPVEYDNLNRIVQARVMGRIGDAEFYEKASQFCPNVTEDQIVEALDQGMSGEGMQLIPGLPANGQGQRDQAAQGTNLSWGFNVDPHVRDEYGRSV